MKKTIPLILVLMIIMAMPVMAQNNLTAMYKVDGDLATAGFQDMDVVSGVGAEEYVGVAVYLKNVDGFNATQFDFTWDSSKATFVEGMSGAEIDDDSVTINGEEVTLAAETGIIDGWTEVDADEQDGSVEYVLANLSGMESAEDWTLMYLLVLETTADFSESTGLTVTSNVSVTDGTTETDLGTRYFLVNGGGNSAQDATWGQIKSQFK